MAAGEQTVVPRFVYRALHQDEDESLGVSHVGQMCGCMCLWSSVLVRNGFPLKLDFCRFIMDILAGRPNTNNRLALDYTFPSLFTGVPFR